MLSLIFSYAFRICSLLCSTKGFENLFNFFVYLEDSFNGVDCFFLLQFDCKSQTLKAILYIFIAYSLLLKRFTGSLVFLYKLFR